MATRICRILLSMVLLGGAVLVGGSTSQADPSVPGKSVSTYATLDKPGFISFGSDGSLYVGNDVNSGSDARIWRISPGGLTVTDYGVALPDPHAVAYDANGTVSGVAGTVWAGADLRMAAMTEDSAVKSFNASGPPNDWGNVNKMRFDSIGRLVIADPSYNGIFVSTGANPARLPITFFSHPWTLAVDASDNIYAGCEDGVIRKYDPEGNVLLTTRRNLARRQPSALIC